MRELGRDARVEIGRAHDAKECSGDKDMLQLCVALAIPFHLPRSPCFVVCATVELEANVGSRRKLVREGDRPRLLCNENEKRGPTPEDANVARRQMNVEGPGTNTRRPSQPSTQPALTD